MFVQKRRYKNETNSKANKCTEYNIQLEKADPLYFNCTWARIVLDHTHYTMFAESDCGNFSYGWYPTPEHESFLRLMCRIEEEYLLGKISDTTSFSLEESKTNTIKNVLDFYDDMSDEELNEICAQIQTVGYCDKGGFYREVDYILQGFNCFENDDAIQIEEDYPVRAKTFAKIFCEILQPELRKELLNEND